MIAYHNNLLTTPEVMTDESGSIVWKADYLPFGKAIINIASTVIVTHLKYLTEWFQAGIHSDRLSNRGRTLFLVWILIGSQNTGGNR